MASKHDLSLEDFVGEALLVARKLPVGRAETPAEEGLGTTWAVGPVGRTRDSGALESSNWETVTEDLEERFEGDVEILRFGHFAVGWIEELAWRAVDDRGQITDVARAAWQWYQALERYPVASEEDLSERESEIQLDNVREAMRDYYNRMDGDERRGKFYRRWEDEDRQDELVHEVWQVLSERDRAGDEQRSVREKDLVEALEKLGLLPEQALGARRKAPDPN